jgi:hypothetical protein
MADRFNAVLLVATLLRDGLFDPGGIGLLPSLTIQGGLIITRGGFNR